MEYDYPREKLGGHTLRSHLKQAGVTPKAISPPRKAVHVFEWFLELSSSRSSGLGGAEPLSYSDLAAWVLLLRIPIKEWEIKALRRMDVVFLKEVSKNG